MAGETDMNLDFESDAVASNVSSYQAFTSIERYNSHQNAVVSSPVRAPRVHSGYFEVHPGDVWSGNNTVRTLANRTTGETVGQEYFYAVSFYIPSSVNPIRNNLIWELHHPSSLYNLSGLGVAPHAIHLRDDGGMKVMCRVATGNGVVGSGWSTWYPNNPLGTVVYDTWMSVLVHLVLTEANAGTVEYWFDNTGTVDSSFGSGTPDFSLYNVPTMPFCNSAGVHNVSLYTEMGLYTGSGSTDKQSIVYISGAWRRTTKANAVATLIGDGGTTPPAPGSSTPAANTRARRIGVSAAGSGRNGFSFNYKSGSKFATGLGAGETGQIKDMHVYVAPNDGSASTQGLKFVVYADSSGEPGALLGSEGTVSVAGNAAAGWQKLTLSTPIEFTGSDIWLMIHADSPTNRLFYATDASSGGLRYNVDTYSDGPSDPAGTMGSDNIIMSIVADYDVASGTDTTAPTIASASVTASSLVMTYDENLAATTPAGGDFVVTVDATPVQVTTVQVSGTTVTLSLGTPVVSGQTVLLSYTQASGRELQDAAGNKCANLSSSAVTNATAAGTPHRVTTVARTVASGHTGSGSHVPGLGGGI